MGEGRGSQALAKALLETERRVVQHGGVQPTLLVEHVMQVEHDAEATRRGSTKYDLQQVRPVPLGRRVIHLAGQDVAKHAESGSRIYRSVSLDRESPERPGYASAREHVLIAVWKKDLRPVRKPVRQGIGVQDAGWAEVQ